jgi:hypothetical protein
MEKIFQEVSGETLPEIATEQRRHDDLLRSFRLALLASDVDALINLCRSIDSEFIWPEAWQRVITIEQVLSDHVKDFFLKLWFHNGSHLRQEAEDVRAPHGGDLLFIMALRKVMPPYTGGDMTLYRGETAANRANLTYGVCWSAQKGIARQHAERGYCRYSRGGSKLLCAKVPASAIITHIGARDGHIEEEFLVDRRGLPENAVRTVEAFIELNPVTR